MTSKALELASENAPKLAFSKQEIETIKDSYAKGATEAELFAFLKVCSMRGLNPLANEIYFVKRNTKNGFVVAHQVGIDGWRSMAAKHPKWAGPGSVEFKDFGKNGRPGIAIATYYRRVGDRIVEVKGEAYWDEFYPGDKEGFMWRAKPRVMLGKCAEVQAIRRAFPEIVGGLSVEGEPIIIDPETGTQEESNDVEKLYGAKTKKKTTKKKTTKKQVEAEPDPEIIDSEPVPEDIENEPEINEPEPAQEPYPEPEPKPEKSEAAKASKKSDDVQKPSQERAAHGLHKPAPNVMRNERLVREASKYSHGKMTRDKILETFGVKSVAEIDEKMSTRLERYIQPLKAEYEKAAHGGLPF